MDEGHRIYVRWGKRALDLIAAGVGLILLSPLLLVCAVLVRLTSPGPIFFRQMRPGLNGRPFRLIKFRTMRAGAEQLGVAVVVRNDPRLSPVGAFLRRSKFDEMPQLLNVLAGDMSLVGPRPRLQNMALERPEDRRLLSVRPGLTSYATIYHRNEEEYCSRQMDAASAYRELERQKRVLDGEYLKHMSFRTDVKLILRTALLVVLGISKAAFGRTRVASHARAGCMLLDAAWFAASVWLAYLLRFDGNLVDFQEPQRNLCLWLLPATQLAACRQFGIYNMVWRYINRVDAWRLVAALTTVSAVALLLRLMMAPKIQFPYILSLPIGIIVLNYLLAVCGALGLRSLRRSLYELEHYYRPGPATTRRRVLIFGAGQDGLAAVLSLQRLAHTEILGFLDDDPAKHECLMAGYRVLGSSEMLAQVLRSRAVSDLVICAPATPRFRSMREICRSAGVRFHCLVPVEDILSAQRVADNRAFLAPEVIAKSEIGRATAAAR